MKILPKWYTFQVESGPFFNYYIQGCKAKAIYVPVESIEKHTDNNKHNTKDSIKIVEITSTKDSVIVRDSIVYKVNEQGEVIGKEVYKWKEKYRENNYLLKQLQSKYDSLLQVKQTEIIKEIPYPVIQEVEVNQLKNWQIILMILGGIFIGFLGYRLYRWIRRFWFKV